MTERADGSLEAGSDGILDPVTFNMLADRSMASLTVPDGRYRVEVRAVDRVGNSTRINDLTFYHGSSRILVIDREAPTVFEYAVEPAFVTDADETIALHAKISERDDAAANRAGNLGESFTTDFHIDIMDDAHKLTGASIPASVTADAGGVTEFSISDLGVENHGAAGMHTVFATVTDPAGNSIVVPVNYFYRNLGIFISSPIENQTVSGTVAIYGSISDPDESNVNPFLKYSLELLRADATQVTGAIRCPDGGNESTTPVRLNNLIGYLETGELTEGANYTIKVNIFEQGIATPTVLVRNVKFGTAAMVVPAIALSADIPDSYDGSGDLSWTYDLSGGLCDVRTEVRGPDGSVVFRGNHAQVMPYKGLSAAADVAGGTFRFGQLADNVWRGEWSEPYSITIECAGAGFQPSDAACGSECNISVTSDRIVISVKNDYVSGTDCWFTVQPAVLSDRSFSVNVAEEGNSVDESLLVFSTDAVKATSNPFTIRTSHEFRWDGAGLTGGPLDNGSYTVYLTATASNGGFAVVNGSVLVSGQQSLQLQLRPDQCTPVLSPARTGWGCAIM